MDLTVDSCDQRLPKIEWQKGQSMSQVEWPRQVESDLRASKTVGGTERTPHDVF